jgi:hypothetical protein
MLLRRKVMLRSVSMKPLRLGLLLGFVIAAGCVPQPEAPPPAPQPQRRPIAPPPQPVPTPPPPAAADWRDLALSPGGWHYRDEGAASIALFGPANSEAGFIVRCDRAARQVTLSREGTSSGNLMTIRTSAGARNLPTSARTEPLPYVSAVLPADDRFLDSIAFSRGRFTVEVPGTPMLVIPAWPEPARVIEDCRL